MADIHVAEIPYPSGTIHFRYSRALADDGSRWIRQGLFVEYAESGAVLAEGRYSDGVEERLWCSFHKSGHKASEGNYVAGKEDGIWRFWNEQGAPEESVTYRNGEAESAQ